jgi:hypothetical protein
MFTTKKEIEAWLKKMEVKDYTINDDLTVDATGHVALFDKGLQEIPFQFGIINGTFSIHNNQLTSLRGSPRKVTEHFNCSYNNLESLEYCPTEIGENMVFFNNPIKTMKYLPKSVGVFPYPDKHFEDLDLLKVKITQLFFHYCDSLDQTIPAFTHLYKLRKKQNTYLLELSPQQLLAETLNADLPHKSNSKSKRLKL